MLASRLVHPAVLLRLFRGLIGANPADRKPHSLAPSFTTDKLCGVESTPIDFSAEKIQVRHPWQIAAPSEAGGDSETPTDGWGARAQRACCFTCRPRLGTTFEGVSPGRYAPALAILIGAFRLYPQRLLHDDGSVLLLLQFRPRAAHAARSNPCLVSMLAMWPASTR